MLTIFKLAVDSPSHRGWGWWWLPTTRTRWGSPCSRCRRTTSSRRTRLATISFEQIVFVPTGDLLWTTSGHVRQPLLPTGWDRSLWKIVSWLVSPPLFRPGGLQRVQVRSVRTRQRGAPLPFQVPQTVKGFCLINHILPRRAHENKGILEKLEKEKSLLKRELRDRVGILLMWKEPRSYDRNNKKMINKEYEKLKNKKWQSIIQ